MKKYKKRAPLVSVSSIQKALYFHASNKSHEYICPNKFLLKWWECDLVSITKAGYLHEFEIKMSRADFLNDFKKGIKHEVMEANYRKQDTVIVESDKRRAKGMRRPKRVDVDGVSHLQCKIDHLSCPSYFWFVVPAGLLKKEDIPEYAGWLEFSKGYIKVIKDAPRLNKNKVSDEVKENITSSMVARFWKMKLKEP